MTPSQQWPTGRHTPTSTPPVSSGPASTGYTSPAQPQIPHQWTPPGVYPTQQTPQPPPRKQRKWPFIVGAVVALLVLVGLVNGGGDTTSPTPAAAAPAPAPAAPVPGPVGPSQAEIDEAQQQLDDINRQLEDRKAELNSMPTAPAAVPAAPVDPAPVTSGPVTTVSDGTYQVGTDMTAGRYKTPGPDGSGALDMCYVSRNKDDSAELDAIIANQIVQGPGSVTVSDGEFAEFSGGCTWTKQ